MVLPYRITHPTSSPVPVVVSVPHCGTLFPEEIKAQYDEALIQAPDDTDWFVDRLYNFAPSLGVTMISAVYSRWVIDLNRDPQSKPLYSDGRIITGLCPTTTFLGQPIYHDKRAEVPPSEIERRVKEYYWPYHKKTEALLAELKSTFGKVLLWDCHSIRQVVSTIQEQKFPDLILGSVDETSAAAELIDLSLKNLGSGSYTLQHNHPFKGGFISRHFGKPARRQHALQLEMTKVNYMDDAEMNFHEERADMMRVRLKETFEALIRQLMKAD
jgi:N-formylglutamate deformylase